MHYSVKRHHLFPVIFFVLLSADVLSQTNKPTTVTQVPAPTQTVATTPVRYNTGETLKVNYVRTREAMGRIADTAIFRDAGFADVKEATQYLDGLGRPLQMVMRQATPGASPMDLVMPVVYDDFGRESYKYLPYVHTADGPTGDGKFKTDPFNSQKSFYQYEYPASQPDLAGEQVFYSQTVYELSQLNRPIKNLAPGNSWAGSDKGVGIQYLANIDADFVRIWTISNNSLTYAQGDALTNIPVTNATYGPGQLYKNVTIDERGNAVVEYKDKEGLVLLKKVQVASAVPADFSGYIGFLCTYYVYDIYNQLRFVIPPKAVTELIGNNWDLNVDPTLVSELCYRYEYDSHQRMIAKKVPGSDWVYMIYDNRDRLIASQDGYLRAHSAAWLGTAYDELNRPVVTGFYYFNFSGVDNLGVSGKPSDIQSLITKYSDENTAGVIQSIQPPPMNLYVAVRKNTSQQVYQAVKSVTFTDEFTAEESAEFHTQLIDYYSGLNYQGVPVSGNMQGNSTIQLPDGSQEQLTAHLDVLTVTHYDDYNWTTQGYTTRYNDKLSAGSNLHVEVLPDVAHQSAVATRGLVTGTEVRIAPSDMSASPSFNPMLYSIPFYDDRGRVIQTQSDNHREGVDIQTNLYDFTGKVLSNYLIHTNLDAGMLNLRVKTDMEYDAGGRLLTTWKSINDNPASRTRSVQNEYDALGKLKRKSLGQKKDINGVYTDVPLETLDYSYNIRGWLKSINGDYANTTSNSNNWFGMDISYDYGFDNNQVNGNIAGIKWRSAGDGEQRAYGFGYDAVSRLMYADFNQSFSSGNSNVWDKADPNSSFSIDFSTKMGDGTTPESAYDENGNIKAMQQWGLKLGSKTLIDDLKYTYYDNSNKLKNVKDFSVDASLTKLGDFKTSTLHPQYANKDAASTDAQLAAITDYTYDVNGNMVNDYNKNISNETRDGIVYNYLNLPVNINFSDAVGKIIGYTYDASGNKLSKSVLEGGNTTTTDYLGGMVYQNNVLQFISDEEGRIRYKPKTSTTPESFAYDYFIKDHLGNVRMVLTDEQQTDNYPAATMETANAVNENTIYSQVDASRYPISSIPGYPTDNYLTPNAQVARTNGLDNKTGPGIVLKVMKGDKFSIYVSSWYKTNATSFDQPVNPLTDIVTALAAGISGMPDAHGTSALTQNSTILNPGITDFLNSPNHLTPADRPKAFLNWVLLDEQFRYVASSSGADPVPAESEFGNGNPSTAIVHPHIKPDLPVDKNGYLYIYVSNETPNTNVFFDNLQVVHTRGPLLEETHYYPFGLAMTGICSKVLKNNYNENKKGFNGNENQIKEFSDGSGFEEYDFNARFYDPQTGRFGQVDPMSDEIERLSPYAFASNDPILRNDPSGLKDTTIHGQTVQRDKDLPEFSKTFSLGKSGSSGTGMGFSGVGLAPSLPRGVTGPGENVWENTWMTALVYYGVQAQIKFSELTRRLAKNRYWITYYKVGPRGQIYVGRCSGFGNSAEEVLRRYDASHRMSSYGPATLDEFVNGSDFANFDLPGSNLEFNLTEVGGYAATRGREQQLYDSYKLQGFEMGNSINPVWKYNPLAPTYWAASTALFGPLAPFGATY